MNLTSITWTKRLFFVLTLSVGIFLTSVPLIIISGAFLTLLLLEKRFSIKIPFDLSAIFVGFIVVSLVFGSYFNFYERFIRLDDILHAFYGAAFAVIGFIVIQFLSEKRGIANDVLIICLFSFCFAVAFGAIWEIYEYLFDLFFDGNMQRTDQGNGVTDTMNDIILESGAAFVVNVFIYFYLKTGAQNWVSKITSNFISENK